MITFSSLRCAALHSHRAGQVFDQAGLSYSSRRLFRRGTAGVFAPDCASLDRLGRSRGNTGEPAFRLSAAHVSTKKEIKVSSVRVFATVQIILCMVRYRKTVGNRFSVRQRGDRQSSWSTNHAHHRMPSTRTQRRTHAGHDSPPAARTARLTAKQARPRSRGERTAKTRRVLKPCARVAVVAVRRPRDRLGDVLFRSVHQKT